MSEAVGTCTSFRFFVMLRCQICCLIDLNQCWWDFNGLTSHGTQNATSTSQSKALGTELVGCCLDDSFLDLEGAHIWILNFTQMTQWCTHGESARPHFKDNLNFNPSQFGQTHLSHQWIWMSPMAQSVSMFDVTTNSWKRKTKNKLTRSIHWSRMFFGMNPATTSVHWSIGDKSWNLLHALAAPSIKNSAILVLFRCKHFKRLVLVKNSPWNWRNLCCWCWMHDCCLNLQEACWGNAFWEEQWRHFVIICWQKERDKTNESMQDQWKWAQGFQVRICLTRLVILGGLKFNSRNSLFTHVWTMGRQFVACFFSSRVGNENLQNKLASFCLMRWQMKICKTSIQDCSTMWRDCTSLMQNLLKIDLRESCQSRQWWTELMSMCGSRTLWIELKSPEWVSLSANKTNELPNCVPACFFTMKDKHMCLRTTEMLKCTDVIDMHCLVVSTSTFCVQPMKMSFNGWLIQRLRLHWHLQAKLFFLLKLDQHCFCWFKISQRKANEGFWTWILVQFCKSWILHQTKTIVARWKTQLQVLLIFWNLWLHVSTMKACTIKSAVLCSCHAHWQPNQWILLDENDFALSFNNSTLGPKVHNVPT